MSIGGYGSTGYGHLNHVTIRYAEWNTLANHLTDEPFILENSSIQNTMSALVVLASSLHKLQMSNVSFINNDSNRVRISADWPDIDATITDNVTLTAQPGLEGYETGYGQNFVVPEGITLTLEPGTSLMMIDGEDGGYLVIEGHLQAIGLPDNPITFTGSITNTGWPPQWEGMFSIGSSHLEWVTFQYAWTAMTVFDGINSDSSAQIIIRNSTFHDNLRGISLHDDNLPRQILLENLVFHHNGFPSGISAMRVEVSVLPYLQMANMQFQDNFFDGIDIHPKSYGESRPLTGTIHLSPQSGVEAYRINDNEPYSDDPAALTIPPNVTFTVDAGVTLLMEDFVDVRVEGKFQTIGTLTQPVIITSSLYSPHYWDGFVVGGGEAHLSHTIIHSAGIGVLTLFPTSTLFLTNTQLIEGLNGLIVQDGTITANCSTFAGNDADGITVLSGGNPNVVIHNSNILANSGKGLNNDSGIQVNALNNWWGAGNGPSGLGSGSGDEVSGNTLYDPLADNPHLFACVQG